MSAASRPSARETQDDAPYEFADARKESFRALAASMSFVGACLMLFGGLAAVFVAGELFAGFMSYAVAAAAVAALCLLGAWWMVSAGRSLSALVATRGRDVVLLMEAVVQLRRIFGLARVVIVAVAVAAVAGGSFIVWCALVSDRGGRCFGLHW
jgi:hypothetical protein